MTSCRKAIQYAAWRSPKPDTADIACASRKIWIPRRALSVSSPIEGTEESIEEDIREGWVTDCPLLHRIVELQLLLADSHPGLHGNGPTEIQNAQYTRCGSGWQSLV